jgi:hypothetical protein
MSVGGRPFGPICVERAIQRVRPGAARVVVGILPCGKTFRCVRKTARRRRAEAGWNHSDERHSRRRCGSRRWWRPGEKDARPWRPGRSNPCGSAARRCPAPIPCRSRCRCCQISSRRSRCGRPRTGREQGPRIRRSGLRRWIPPGRRLGSAPRSRARTRPWPLRRQQSSTPRPWISLGSKSSS